MDIIQIIVLGLVQGLTEFLPVSSSAHLVLTSILFGWQDQGLFMDIAAHAGSLCAVLLYFRKEVQQMIVALLNPTAPEHGKDIKLIGGIVVATIPIIIAGLLFADAIEFYARSPLVIAVTTIIFALLLAYADRVAKNERTEYQLNWKDVIFIGCAQAIALIPGTSRSGITITAGLMLGMTKVAAARFSFLISIPTILAAIAYKSLQVMDSSVKINLLDTLSIFIISGVVAYACIDVFLRLVNKIGMLPFVVYRILLGVGLFLFIYL